MKLKILILSMVTIMFCLSGCVEVSIVSDSNYEMYSRKDTEIMQSSDNFGYGRSDDVYVALSYVYENESISKSYGNEFEITPEDIVCYKSEGETSGIKSNFKGFLLVILSLSQNSDCCTRHQTFGATNFPHQIQSF